MGLFAAVGLFVTSGVCDADGTPKPTPAERLEMRIQERIDLIRAAQGVPLDLPHEEIEGNAWRRINQIESWFGELYRAYAADDDEASWLGWYYPSLVHNLEHEPIEEREERDDQHAMLVPRYRLFLETGGLNDARAMLDDRVFVPPIETFDDEFETLVGVTALFRIGQSLMIDRAVLLAMDEPERAASNLAAIIHLNDQLRWRGTVIDQMVLGAPRRVGLDVLRYELLLGHLDARGRAAHLRALNALPGPPPESFWHESVCRDLLIHFEMGNVHFEEAEGERRRALAALPGLVEDVDSAILVRVVEAIDGVVSVPEERVRDLERARTRFFRRFLAASHHERRIVIRIADPESFLDALDDRYARVTVPTPTLRNFFAVDAYRIYRDLTHLMLAVEVYRDERGRLPDSLEQLVPDYLAVLPVDPFADDGRYRYTTDDAGASPLGYLLYSVGFDGEDNGGRPFPDDLRAGWNPIAHALRTARADGHDWVVSIPHDGLGERWLPVERMPLEALIEMRREHDRGMVGDGR